MEYEVKSPIIFIVFNRYDKALAVFKQISEVKPSKMYIVADGPRDNNFEDKEKCKKVRSIFESIDWQCDVVKLYSDVNLGCAIRVFSGISEVFSLEEKAIVLEDDCLPDLSFFKFCDELLDKYKEDERIMLISGTNVNQYWDNDEFSYHFSKLGGIHGWASWRRAWEKVDLDIKLWEYPRIKGLLKKQLTPKFYLNRSKIYDKLLNNSQNANTWDYQFGFARLINSGLSIVPSHNLIKNIGFGADSTHTKNENSKTAKLQTSQLRFPLKHPSFVIDDREYDEIFEKILYPTTVKSIVSRYLSILKNIR